MNIDLYSAFYVGPVFSLIAGILILIKPHLLNYIIAIYLIFIGLIGVIGVFTHFWGLQHLQ